MPIVLEVLNDMTQADFTGVLGDIFEHAPWIADAAYGRRPFATVTALHEAMLAGLAAASPQSVTGFLNNHPDLAAPAVRAHTLTTASTQEQAAAGLDALSQEEAARLVRWNAEYRERFGFPFIICARRHTHGSILGEIERRLAGDIAAERVAALAEIARITALRLSERVEGPGMPKIHGRLSTHLLDTARGSPAAGVEVRLVVLSADNAPQQIAEAITDADGRTPQPLISGRPIPTGTYELHFHIGDYIEQQSAPPSPRFLDIVPVRFHVAEPEAHYHIPLLFTPWSYSTYRGT